MATELFNEKQETIFDTKLSKAADNFTKAHLEAEGWKKKRKDTEKALIEAMKEKNITLLNLPQNKQIKYSYSEAKEKIVIKDYKPKQRKARASY